MAVQRVVPDTEDPRGHHVPIPDLTEQDPGCGRFWRRVEFGPQNEPDTRYLSARRRRDRRDELGGGTEWCGRFRRRAVSGRVRRSSGNGRRGRDRIRQIPQIHRGAKQPRHPCRGRLVRPAGQKSHFPQPCGKRAPQLDQPVLEPPRVQRAPGEPVGGALSQMQPGRCIVGQRSQLRWWYRLGDHHPPERRDPAPKQYVIQAGGEPRPAGLLVQ
jgi:hypothetical protein